MFESWIFNDDIAMYISPDDLGLVPEDILKIFGDQIRNYEIRLTRLVDQFAVTIYNTHIQGSILAAINGSAEFSKELIDHAEPKEVTRKAWTYAKCITEMEYTAILEIIKDMKVIIKESKETEGGIN